MVQKMLMWLARLVVVLVLFALVAVSPAAAKAKKKTERPSMQASTISDKRIDESSSLAISRKFNGIVYTANDNPKPIVFAIDINSGAVVGTTEFWKGKIGDPEALAIDRQGTLWLADIGDNLANRSDAALYAFAEQGAKKHVVSATRYPISYSDGLPHNAETLLINPTSGAKFIVTKVFGGPGEVYALPSRLRTDLPNVAVRLGRAMPKKVSDGCFSPNGAWVVIRTDSKLYTVDPRSWGTVQSAASPKLFQGESVAFNPYGTGFLVGSEGTNSPLVWVAFNQADGTISP